MLKDKKSKNGSNRAVMHDKLVNDFLDKTEIVLHGNQKLIPLRRQTEIRVTQKIFNISKEE